MLVRTCQRQEVTPRFAGDRIYRWLLLFFLGLIGFLNCIDRITTFGVFPVLRKERGAPDVPFAMVDKLCGGLPRIGRSVGWGF